MDRRIQHLRRMVGEIEPFSVVERRKIEGWSVKELGNFAIFSKKIYLEKVEKGESAFLVADFGGEALVRIDGRAFGQFNEYHEKLDITPVADGREHDFEIEVVPRGLFGRRREDGFSHSHLVIENVSVRRFVEYIRTIIEVAEEISGDLKSELMEILETILNEIWTPRSSEIYTRTVDLNRTIREVRTVWNVPNFPESEGFGDVSRQLGDRVGRLLEGLKERFKRLESAFPKPGKVSLAGHSHIDYAWLWPVSETKRKIVRTFSNALRLIEKYPDFVFLQSSAQFYDDLKREDPQLFKKVKEAVEEGRWEVVGGSWLENDCNVPSLESLIRQFYYGQTFFEREFGIRCDVAWYPDVFGFPWTLPQVLKEAGIDVFVTTKLNWNDTNRFPHDLCVWKGIDGSEVIYYSFENEDGGYNGTMSARSILSTWRNFRSKGKTGEVFLTFGYGDGGGGPTDGMVERASMFSEIPGIPRTEMSKLSDFAEKLRKLLDELPIWDGELYLELHRGTYTSQLRTKMLHDRLQDLLREVEILDAFGDWGIGEGIEDFWKTLLKSEFHDILPGSSIREVYDEIEAELKGSIDRLEKVMENGDGSVLFNPSSFGRESVVFEMKRPLRLRVKGEEAKVEKAKDGYVCAVDVGLDPLEVVHIEILGEVNVKDEGEIKRPRILENEHMFVEFEDDGSFNVFSKRYGRWAFSGNSFLALYKNVPFYWDNWEIDPSAYLSERRLKASRVEKVEENSIREVLEVEYSFEGSRVVLNYVLERDSDVLKVFGKADWHTRRSVLKAVFPVNVLSRKALFDLDGGFVERATTENTSNEKAMFEVPFQRWIDVGERGFHVAVLTVFHHGASVRGSTIGLTLVKAGIYPDFFADEGKLEFEYAIFPNSGDVIEIVKRSDLFARRPRLFKKPVPERSVSVSGSLKVLSFRRVKNAYQMRLVEFSGSRGKGEVRFRGFSDLSRVRLVNVLGDPIEDVPFSKDLFEFEYLPFKIYTFEISFV